MFWSRFVHSGDLADGSAAISHLHSAAICSVGSPTVQLDAALKWARSAVIFHHSSALQAYTVVFDHLPQVAWMGQTILARHSKLISIGNIASEAAAAAISAAQCDTALEWLEQGRSVVWNQLLQLRTPVDVLREEQPTLANDLLRVSTALEHASNRGVSIHNISPQFHWQISMEEDAQRHRRLAEEWKELVTKTRDIPGFSDFLQPKKLPQLCRAADAGPVVVVNVHEHRCDALVLMAGLDDVMHIPLSKFSYKNAQTLHQSLNQLLQAAQVRAQDTRLGRVQAKTTTDVGFPSILSNLWSSLVEPVLNGLAITVSYLILTHFLD